MLTIVLAAIPNGLDKIHGKQSREACRLTTLDFPRGEMDGLEVPWMGAIMKGRPSSVNILISSH